MRGEGSTCPAVLPPYSPCSSWEPGSSSWWPRACAPSPAGLIALALVVLRTCRRLAGTDPPRPCSRRVMDRGGHPRGRGSGRARHRRHPHRGRRGHGPRGRERRAGQARLLGAPAPADGPAARAPGRGLEPEVGRRQGPEEQPGGRGPQAGYRADRAEAGRRSRRTRAGRGGARRRRADGCWRRRHAGAGRHDRGRARPPVRVHPRRDQEPLRPRPRRRSQRRRRGARGLRRRGREARRPRRGGRPDVRQQRLAGPVRGGGAERRLPRREDPDHPRHRADDARQGSVDRVDAGAALDRDRMDARRGPPRSSSCRTMSTASVGSWAPAPGRAWTAGCSA